MQDRRVGKSCKWSVFSFKGKRVIGDWGRGSGKKKKRAEPGSVGILPAPHGVSPGM